MELIKAALGAAVKTKKKFLLAGLLLLFSISAIRTTITAMTTTAMITAPMIMMMTEIIVAARQAQTDGTQ